MRPSPATGSGHALGRVLIVVTVVLILLGAGLPVPPVAADGEADRIPWSHPGDVVRYNATTSDGGNDPSNWRFEFTINGTTDRADRFGRDVNVRRIRGGWIFDPESRMGFPFETTYRLGGYDPMTYTMRLGYAAPVPLGIGTVGWEGGYGFTSWDGLQNWTLACLPRAGWQGRSASGLGGADLHDLCPGLRARSGHPAPLELQGNDRIAGHDLHVYRATPGGPDGGTTVRLGFAAGLPYPVTVRIAEADRTRTLTLSEFDPGAGDPLPLAERSSADLARRPSLEFDEPGLWGVVEGDPAAYPYPPSEAIQRIEDDPTLPTFRTYRQDHPDAQVVAYTSFRDREGEDAAHAAEMVWRFVFNDPSGEGYRVTSRKLVRVGSGDEGVPPPSPTVRNNGSRVRLPPLDGANLPARTVAVSDVAALWRRSADGDHTFNYVHAVLQDDLIPPGDGPFVPGRDLVVGHVNASGGVSVSDPGALASEGVLDGYIVRLTSGASVARLSARTASHLTLAGLSDSDTGDPRSLPRVEPVADAAAVGAAAAGVGVLGAAIVFLRRWLLAGAARVLAPLFTRIHGEEVLENETRARILERVRADPGVHVRELERRVDAGNGALFYHLEVLEREGFLTRIKARGYTRFFPSDSLSHREMEKRALLRAGSLGDIYETVRTRPGLSLQEVADALDLATATTHEAIGVLVEAGLLRKKREGRSVSVYPDDDGPDET